jgi:hypothetical protein
LGGTCTQRARTRRNAPLWQDGNALTVAAHLEWAGEPVSTFPLAGVPGETVHSRHRWDDNSKMNSTTEEQHISVVRQRLAARFPTIDSGVINQAIDTAHHQFDGRPVRDFVPLLVERAALRSLTDDT